MFNIPTEGEQDTDGEKIDLLGKRIGAFESDEARKKWVDSCKSAFENADSLAKLKDIESFYHEKLIIMGVSDDPLDKNLAGDIRAIYTKKNDEFLASAKKGKL